jgi:23S rRNA (cytosine1962-C5)-methyltransferase
MTAVPGKPARATVTRAGARRLRAGHVWLFREEIERAPEAAGGDVVEVFDPQGNPIGQGFWAARSKLAFRLLTRDRTPVTPELFRQRLQRAWQRRQELFPGADAYRLVHGESDLLPGFIVDRFGDTLTLQTLSEGADRRKEEWAGMLDGMLKPRTIALRDDGSSRDFEGLPREQRLLKGTDPKTTFHEGKIAYAIDVLQDHKTGAFLDQQENHVHARSYARGRGLDTFSYHGGFALQLAQGCDSVIAVEADERAGARISENARANRLGNVEVRTANAFDVLRDLERQGAQFEVVVIDPPAFTKRKEGMPSAERAYKELNLRAFKLLAPDGILITCSCSAKMVPEFFERIVLEAANDAGRSAQLLERRGAGRDHPMLAAVPETAYLKCSVYRAL